MLFSKWISSVINIFSWLYYAVFVKNIHRVFLALLLKKKCLAVSKNFGKRNFIIPRSVNYHFTRQCNYECGFCFHTAKTSFVLPIEEAKKGLQLLRDAGEN